MHEIPKLDRQGLRNFGLTMAVILGTVFGVIIPLLRRHESPVWIWAIAGLFASFALVAPGYLNPVYHIWMRFGMVLGWVETRIILGLVFYGLILPMGLVMRLKGRDPMHRRIHTHEPSYRIDSRIRTRESLEKPF